MGKVGIRIGIGHFRDNTIKTQLYAEVTKVTEAMDICGIALPGFDMTKWMEEVLWKKPSIPYENAIDEAYKEYGGKAKVWSKREPLGAVVAKGEAKVGDDKQDNTIFASHGSSLAVMLSALKHSQGQLVAKDVVAIMQGESPEQDAPDANKGLL